MNNEKISPTKRIPKEHFSQSDSLTVIIGEGHIARTLCARCRTPFVLVSRRREDAELPYDVIIMQEDEKEALRKAHIRRATAFAAVSDDCEFNERMALLARDKYKIDSIVALTEAKLEGISCVSLKSVTNRIARMLAV